MLNLIVSFRDQATEQLEKRIKAHLRQVMAVVDPDDVTSRSVSRIGHFDWPEFTQTCDELEMLLNSAQSEYFNHSFSL